jgi:hypothetical protein
MYAIIWGREANLQGQFERVWVVQEIANAAQAFVHIGGIVLGWEYLSSIIAAMRSFNVDVNMLQCNGVKSICILNTLREDRQEMTKNHLDSLCLSF